MRHRATSVGLLTTALLAGLAVATPAAAQSGAKILTPPRPADTTRTQAARLPPKTTPGASAPAPATAAPAAAPAAMIPQSPMLDSIREAVFHSLLERDRAGFATLASAFCLGLSTNDFKKATTSADRADPAESMVKRLATPRAPARRASTCTFQPNAPGRSVAGRPLLYSVGAIDVSSPGRAEAAAGYNYDGYSAGGFTFSVERSDSGWVVKQWRL
jgi:hypothetical protein